MTKSALAGAAFGLVWQLNQFPNVDGEIIFSGLASWAIVGVMLGLAIVKVPKAFLQRKGIWSTFMLLGFLFGVVTFFIQVSYFWEEYKVAGEFSKIYLLEHRYPAVIANAICFSIIGWFIGLLIGRRFEKNEDGSPEVVGEASSTKKADSNYKLIPVKDFSPVIVHYTNSKGKHRSILVRPETTTISGEIVQVRESPTNNRRQMKIQRLSNPEVLGIWPKHSIPHKPPLAEPMTTPFEAPSKGDCPSCNNSNIRMWDGKYRCWNCGYVLNEEPQAPLPPVIEIDEEELPPILEPKKSLLGDESGPELHYRRSDGTVGVIHFEPSSVEIIKDRVNLCPKGIQRDYAIALDTILNPDILNEPDTPEVAQPPLPPVIPVPEEVTTPEAPQYEPGIRVVFDELPLDTYDAFKVMRRLKPELSPFEIHEAFELDRNSLLQGYEQEHAQTILEDLQSAGCQVRLHTVGETAVVEPEVRSEQETLPFRTPTEEEFHEIRMGTDRHRVISLITSGELDLNATDPQGYPLLHGMQNARIASLLIEHGATVNAVDNEFNTPLHNCDDSATQEVLIENGVAINATNRTGDTALHRWAARGTLAPVKTLLHFNADPTVRNHEGNNALQSAQEAQESGVNGDFDEVISLIATSMPTHGDTLPPVIEDDE